MATSTPVTKSKDGIRTGKHIPLVDEFHVDVPRTNPLLLVFSDICSFAQDDFVFLYVFVHEVLASGISLLDHHKLRLDESTTILTY